LASVNGAKSEGEELEAPQGFFMAVAGEIYHNASLRVPLRRAVRGFPAEAVKQHVFSPENTPESPWCVLPA